MIKANDFGLKDTGDDFAAVFFDYEKKEFSWVYPYNTDRLSHDVVIGKDFFNRIVKAVPLDCGVFDGSLDRKGVNRLISRWLYYNPIICESNRRMFYELIRGDGDFARSVEVVCRKVQGKKMQECSDEETYRILVYYFAMGNLLEVFYGIMFNQELANKWFDFADEKSKEWRDKVEWTN